MLSSADWQRVLEFIDAREPGFRGRLRGATPERIAELQGIHMAKLPQAYVDFLSLMGEDHGSFELSWEHYSTVEPLLLNGTAPEGWRQPYPEMRYLWIAGQEHEDNESCWGDLYLDLEGADADDPPVLIHDFFDDEHREAPGAESVLALRFSDLIQSNAYADYEQVRHAYQYWFSLSFSKKKSEAVWERLREVLRSMGWCECLPGSESTWFGQHEQPISLDVKSTRAGQLRLLVGGSERKPILSIAEEIADAFPRQANPGKWFAERDEA